MDASDLRVFEAVARLGGMNRAAAELNTVQSNVTARIRSLEDELGTPLFHRHARGVELTDAGRRLLPYAAQVRATLQDARRAVADAGTPAGPLTIGSLETTAALRLSPILAGYARGYPEVDLIIRTGTTCELVQQVLDAQLEGAFVCGPIEHAELAAEPVFREELVLITAPDVRTIDDALKRELRLIVLRAGCSYRERLESILARRGLRAARLLEFGTLEAIVGCVAAGLGVTLLPRSLVGAMWNAARVGVHALPAADATVETQFIRRRDAFVSSALAAFLALTRPAQSRAAAE
jgi:LysR family transcriptional regulator, cell division regulator